MQGVQIKRFLPWTTRSVVNVENKVLRTMDQLIGRKAYLVPTLKTQVTYGLHCGYVKGFFDGETESDRGSPKKMNVVCKTTDSVGPFLMSLGVLVLQVHVRWDSESFDPRWSVQLCVGHKNTFFQRESTSVHVSKYIHNRF